MRTLLAAAVGVVLLVGGGLAGVAGLGLAATDPCPATYRVALQPATAVADPPAETVSPGGLPEPARTAVRAALADEPFAVGSREALAPVTDVTVVAEGRRYVATVERLPCRTPYDELAVGGFLAAGVGFFATLYAVLVWRHG